MQLRLGLQRARRILNPALLCKKERVSELLACAGDAAAPGTVQAAAAHRDSVRFCPILSGSAFTGQANRGGALLGVLIYKYFHEFSVWVWGACGVRI